MSSWSLSGLKNCSLAYAGSTASFRSVVFRINTLKCVGSLAMLQPAWPISFGPTVCDEYIAAKLYKLDHVVMFETLEIALWDRIEGVGRSPYFSATVEQQSAKEWKYLLALITLNHSYFNPNPPSPLVSQNQNQNQPSNVFKTTPKPDSHTIKFRFPNTPEVQTYIVP